MEGYSSQEAPRTGRLRRSVMLGLGLALFALGATILSIGLIGYFDGDSPPVAPSTDESASDLIPLSPVDIEDVERLPVAIPYYNPQSSEPQPPPVAAPLRMVIDAIDVDAPVVEMGMDGDGVPYVPLNAQDVAWYNFSSLPGAGSNAVFAGHINWERAQAVFGRLDELQTGDRVRLVSDDGREYTYEVFANFPVDPEDPASLKVMAPTPTDTITLITCGGTWIPDPSERFGGDYTNRTIVQARLLESTLAVPVPSSISDG